MNKKSDPIALITDTTADIPIELVEKYGILRVAQHLIWGTEDYRDQVDIDAPTFYQRLPTDPIHPKTSQPTVQDFVEAYEKAKETGAKEAVVIVISNQLSATVNSANQAIEHIDLSIHVVDSLSVSMGLGWQVIAAARAREAGGDAEAMIAVANKVRETVQIIFSVDTLEYLHKGGRIGGASRLLGTALQLKPQLYVDHTIGRIEPGEKVRTRKKSLERMYEVFFMKMDTGKPMRIAVLHAAAADDAEAIAARIKKEYNPVEIFVTAASPVVGTHAGPGTVGLCGYYECED